MAVTEELRAQAGTTEGRITAVLSVLGYVFVLGTFAGLLPWPQISDDLVVLLGHAIAVTNATALLAIVLGVRWIKRGDVGKHRAAMLTAFALILLFLSMYLLKIGGGFEKAIEVTGAIYWAYLLMLAVHIGLSVVAVPFVIHAAVLGLSNSPDELRDTIHARVGRIAAAAWGLSLALGILTYLMLTVYGWHPRGEAVLALVAVPATRWRP